METLFLKKITTLLVRLTLLFFSTHVHGQLDSILHLPCPLGGQSTKIISGQLSPDSDTRKKPIFLNTCIPSNNEYPYQTFWARIPHKNQTLKVKNHSEVDVAIYHAGYFSENATCEQLLYIINAQSELDITLDDNDYDFWVVVVHSAIVNAFPTYSLEFSEEIQIYEPDCFVKYNCITDSLLSRDNDPIFHPSIRDQITKNEVVVLPTINNVGTLLKTYTIDNQIITKSEELIFSLRLNEIPEIDELPEFSISCKIGQNIDPRAIYTYLSTNLGDSIAQAYQWVGKFDTPNICNNLFYSFTDKIIQGEWNQIPYTIIRIHTFLDYNTGERKISNQKITIHHDEPVKILPIEDQVLYISDDWQCTATLEFPIPNIKSSCPPNLRYLSLFDKNGREYPLINGKFGEVVLPKGNYKFYYIYNDGNPADTAIFHVTVIANPIPNRILNLPDYYVDSASYEISIDDLKQYVHLPCTDNIDITFEEPKTPCDTINDGKINICCEMITNPGSGYYVKVILKTYILDSLDQIVLKDSIWQLSLLNVGQISHQIICPKDTTLDCLTSDWSPAALGHAITLGACLEQPIYQHMDYEVKINDLQTKITRFFTDKNWGGDLLICHHTILLECTSGIEGHSENYPITAWPNPFHENLIIAGDFLDAETKVECFNVNGQVMKGDIIFDKVNNQILVDGQQWPSESIYFYQVVSKGKIYSGKVVKW